jgi:5-methylcytosine-specific restriction endonuclease McrA
MSNRTEATKPSFGLGLFSRFVRPVITATSSELRKAASLGQELETMAGLNRCPECGVLFAPSLGRGRPRLYCTKACTVIACEREKSARISRKRRARWPTICAHCGKGMVPAQNRTLCSNACKVAVHKARDPVRTRTARTTHGAIRRSWYEDGEAFDPTEILERDGWRCRLCGCKTPKGLRGTRNPRAPELDHIVPLSKGGKHTRLNTACACKRCNGSKHAKVMGQLRLVA